MYNSRNRRWSSVVWIRVDIRTIKRMRRVASYHVIMGILVAVCWQLEARTGCRVNGINHNARICAYITLLPYVRRSCNYSYLRRCLRRVPVRALTVRLNAISVPLAIVRERKRYRPRDRRIELTVSPRSSRRDRREADHLTETCYFFDLRLSAVINVYSRAFARNGVFYYQVSCILK